MMLLDICEPNQTPTINQNASVGIDLGTTNSLVAISNNGIREVVEDENGQKMLPSIVAYGNDGQIIVGNQALEEVDFIRSVKRLMGRGIEDIKKIAGKLPFEIIDNDGVMVTINLNGHHVTPVEISAEILRTLKNRAEKQLDNIVDRAVITVPAYFDDAARQATKDAAKLAGLEVMRLVNEPTAAALAYGLDNGAEGVYAIYDLGGGTFDVSLLKMEKGVFQVLATGGDSALGGDDFDHAIVEYFISQYPTDGELSNKAVKNLIAIARSAKEILTIEDNFTSDDGKYSISSGEFEKLIEPMIGKTIHIIQNILVDSKVKRDDIEGIVLVGGSTRIPLVRRRIEEFFAQPPLTNLDPDLVVATGAAIQSESLSQGGNTLLIDVTPLSLGLETMGGLTEVIIPRNTPIPTQVSQKFTTFKDNQTGLKIHVVQGEREMVFQNRSLANFELQNIPPMQAGAAVIEVTFTLDADGLLTISAKEELTNIVQNVEVKPSYGLAAEQIEKMLHDSMINAREDIMTRLLAQARVEADVAINGVICAIEKDGDLLDGNYHKKINQQLDIVRELKKSDHRDSLDYEVAQLDKICVDFAEMRINRAVGSFLEGQSINDVNRKIS